MESRCVMPPSEAFPRYVWGRGGLVRLRILTAKRPAEAFSSAGSGDGFRARVMWCQKKAHRASLVENASAASLRSPRCSGEK